MADVSQHQGYSAEVRLQLRADGELYDLARVGPNRCVPRNPIELNACDAEVLMFVDGDLFVWPVRLPHGAVPFDKNVTTLPTGEMQRRGKVES